MLPEITSTYRANLKVGDMIGVSDNRYWRDFVGYSLKKIVKISPTGRFTLEDGTRFTKDGYEITSSRYKSSLVTRELAEQNIARYNAAIELQKLIHNFKTLWEKSNKLLNKEQLETLNNTLNKMVDDLPQA